MVQVKVKHGKDLHEVQLDTTKDVKTFKAVLEKVTGVPPERQTLMSKGAWIGTLKDDKDLSTLKSIVDGHLVTLMGTATKVPEVPKEVRGLCEACCHSDSILLPIQNNRANHACFNTLLYRNFVNIGYQIRGRNDG